MAEPEYDIELLGQKIKYPKTTSSGIAVSGIVLILCITLYGIFWLYVSHPDAAYQIFTLATGTYKRDQKEFTPTNTFQIGFWTPSTNTWDYLVDVSGGEKEIKEEDKWQIIAKGEDDLQNKKEAQKKINDFGKKLRFSGFVSGWRHYEVKGYGDKTFKPGLWWVASSKQAIDPEDFAKFYLDFWGDSADEVYIEILTNVSKRIPPD